jgi:DNA-binding NtrC family response regulator
MIANMAGIEQKLGTLIVDDDISIVKLVESALRRQFPELLEVSGTIEPGYVWGMAASRKVDICVTDMNMPTINGFKLLKHLKGINPLTQVIFLTAHPTLEAAQSAFMMGVDDFLAKPIDLDMLCESIRFTANRAKRWQVELVRDPNAAE